MAGASFAPMQGIPLSRDDKLLVRALSGVGADTFYIIVIRQLANGSIQHSRHEFATAAANTLLESEVELGDGVLISCSAQQFVDGYIRGRLFVSVQVQKGTSGDDQPHSNIISGYVLTNKPLTWPHNIPESSLEGPGRITVVKPSDPAAASNFSTTVPDNVRWRIQSVRFTYAADANAATRVVTFDITDGSVTIYDMTANTGVSANQTFNFVCSPLGASEVLSSSNLSVPIPKDLFVLGTWSLRVLATNKQVGDQISDVRITVEEWVEISNPD